MNLSLTMKIHWAGFTFWDLTWSPKLIAHFQAPLNISKRPFFSKLTRAWLDSGVYGSMFLRQRAQSWIQSYLEDTFCRQYQLVKRSSTSRALVTELRVYHKGLYLGLRTTRASWMFHLWWNLRVSSTLGQGLSKCRTLRKRCFLYPF